MENANTSNTLSTSDLATVLEAVGALLVSFHRSDLALQSALSTLAAHARTTPEMIDLQHVDLTTQTHADLAKLMAELAACVFGRPTTRQDLKSALTLRSLQDSLIEPAQSTDAGPPPGELSLF